MVDILTIKAVRRPSLNRNYPAHRWGIKVRLVDQIATGIRHWTDSSVEFCAYCGSLGRQCEHDTTTEDGRMTAMDLRVLNYVDIGACEISPEIELEKYWSLTEKAEGILVDWLKRQKYI